MRKVPDAMLRRRSAAYEAAAVVGAKGSEPETLARLDSKDAFFDLRIDMCERAATAAAAVRSSAASKAARSPSVKAAHAERARAIAVASQPGVLGSSDLQHALRRCQSASTIRKKLLHAVEQSSSQMTHDQLALLRSLAASAATKPTPKTLLSRQLSSSEPVSAAVYTTGVSSRPSSAAATSLLRHHNQQQSHKSRNQDSFASTSTPSRSKNVHTSSSCDAAGLSQRTHGTTRVVGGYKSNTVQLEVELAERLNEIERSKLNEKAVSRFRACQKTLDVVIQQDELYGRLLSKIRDEINAYVDVVSAARSRRDSTPTQDCCACSRAPSNQTSSSSNDLDFENALFRQENTALKKNCAALQREIEVLQQSLLFATSSKPSDRTVLAPAAALAPEQASLDDDDDDDESELSEIQLLPDAECHQALRRPLGIPPLDFTALSPYSEEADDDDDENDDEAFESGY